LIKDGEAAVDLTCDAYLLLSGWQWNRHCFDVLT
jgi:hypothetical protein